MADEVDVDDETVRSAVHAHPVDVVQRHAPEVRLGAGEGEDFAAVDVEGHEPRPEAAVEDVVRPLEELAANARDARNVLEQEFDEGERRGRVHALPVAIEDLVRRAAQPRQPPRKALGPPPHAVRERREDGIGNDLQAVRNRRQAVRDGRLLRVRRRGFTDREQQRAQQPDDEFRHPRSRTRSHS